MNKKNALIVAALLVVIFTLVLLIVKPDPVTQPLQELVASSITEISLKLTPPDISLTADPQEREKLIELLQKVMVYEEDETEYMGQVVNLTLTKADGTELAIALCSPSITVNGKSYKAHYESCDALVRFTEKMRKSREGQNLS